MDTSANLDGTQTKAKAAAAATSTSGASLEVKMLRRQVKTLTAENEKLKKEVASLRKRAASTPSTAAPSSKKAKTAGQKKKLFEKWAKALIRESKKHKINNAYGCEPYEVTVKDTGVWSPEEFASIFGGHGTKIQPTPDNKPTSVITILRFSEFDDVKNFFADVGGMTGLSETGYEVQIWRQRSFQKSFKCRDADAKLVGMDVHYNKSKHALSFVFLLEMQEEAYW